MIWVSCPAISARACCGCFWWVRASYTALGIARPQALVGVELGPDRRERPLLQHLPLVGLVGQVLDEVQRGLLVLGERADREVGPAERAGTRAVRARQRRDPDLSVHLVR